MTTEEAKKTLGNYQRGSLWQSEWDEDSTTREQSRELSDAIDTILAALAASEAARERAERKAAQLAASIDQSAGNVSRAAYAGVASTLRDLASRIGVAAMPEWIRQQIEREAHKHGAWSKGLAANLDATATEQPKQGEGERWASNGI